LNVKLYLTFLDIWTTLGTKYSCTFIKLSNRSHLYNYTYILNGVWLNQNHNDQRI
jgi:hypothetical protein